MNPGRLSAVSLTPIDEKETFESLPFLFTSSYQILFIPLPECKNLLKVLII